VTFDDGYADNLYEAKPILERYAIPATVFVCTGYAGKEFWWDELDRIVMSSTADLDSLRLDFNKSQFTWNSPSHSLEVNSGVRRKLRRELYNFLLTLDVDEQTQALDTIRNWTGVSSGDTFARAMTAAELLQLVRGGLIQLGAHTRHHPMLPRLPLDRQREEIVASKQDLQGLLNDQVEGFAYPNGRATEAIKKIVHDEGFVFACTSLEDVVSTASDLHALPRFWQKDVDGDTFFKDLRLWMQGG
jgi:peptidoglycan/xylan/chitin deacetylase (PgdA/CDA1 family)